MRLIDADKFEAFVIRTNGDEEFVNGVQYVLERIDNDPTVDAIVIPDDATNRMVLKALYPDVPEHFFEGYLQEWLDSPYTTEG